MPIRRLGLFVAALLLASCGDSGNTLLIGVNADDTVSQYDLYVFDAQRTQLTRSGWTTVSKDLTSTPLKIGLRFAQPGKYTVVMIGTDDNPPDGDRPAVGAKQFFFAKAFDVTGNVEVSGTLLHVPNGDDHDRDLFPDSVAWPQDVPAAANIDVALLDCDDKMDFPAKNGHAAVTADQIRPFLTKEICGDGIDELCNGDGDEQCVDSDGDGDPDDTDCKPQDPKIHHPTGMDPFPETPNCCGYNLGKTGADANMAFDSDPSCHKGTCDDGIDQDCSANGDPSGDAKCFADADCDGYRAAAKQDAMCMAPADKDQTSPQLDCNDCSGAVNPGVKEVCGNNVDDNCNGQVDEGCVGCDLDGDGFERDDKANGCPDAMNGGKPLDCNDEDAGVFPGSTTAMFPVNPKLTYLPPALANCNGAEGGTVCGALRGDCRNKNVDGSSPQDADCDGTAWKSCPPANCDKDGDGYIDMNQAGTCDPQGLHAGSYDCNDNDPKTFPNAPPVCGEMSAHNCSAVYTCPANSDKDGDGYDTTHDCDDNNAAVHPFATELCNGIDDDCDGLTDEGNPDGAGNPMVKNNAVLTCNDSNVGECKPLIGHCVCSASPVDKLYFDQASRAAGKTACPAEDVEVDTGSKKAAVAPRCYGALQPKPQSCDPMNPKDDDCDGRVDAPDGKNANVPPLFGSPIDVVAKGTKCWPAAKGQCAPSGANALVVGCDMSKTNCYAPRGVNPWYVCDGTEVCPVPEKCNGFDDDCEGTLPNNEKDLDGDKYLACGSPYGQYTSGQPCEQMLAPGLLGCGDCFDNPGSTPGLNGQPINNMQLNPGAADICNGVDDDCNPTTAEGASDCAASQTKVCCGQNGCKNPSNDVNNCNGCGMICVESNAVPACVNSSCAIQSCNAPFADCNTQPKDGCEINTNTDPVHCGGCPNNCSNNNIAIPVCTNGMCTGNCNVGFLDCDGNKLNNGCEINSQSDPLHCGACPNACSNNNIAVPTCAGGMCTGNCNAGFADCDGNKLANGCEINLNTDADHCGACLNRVCSANNMATRTCAGGNCNGNCAANFADCDGNKLTNGCEVSLLTDPNNCNACGTVCSANNMATRTCGGGICNGNCAANFADCDGNKLNNGCETPTTTVANCAGCGNVCAPVNASNASAGCTGATCFYTCNAGWKDCQTAAPDLNGCETHTDVDTGNCGDCGRACAGTQVAGLACAGGLCTSTCNAGFANCTKPVAPGADDGCETHIAIDINNCGACGRACAGTNVSVKACSGGLCTSTCAAGFSNCNQPPGGSADDGCETHSAIDINNCGGCGIVCSASHVTQSCASGVCNGACIGFFADCNGNKQTDGCETPTNTTTDCAGCGNVCNLTNAMAASCNGTTCSYTCNAGFTDCNAGVGIDTDGCEINTAGDPNHCGGCANVCSANNMATRTCGGGVCNGNCAANTADCDGNKLTNGCEVSLLTDPNNCSACGTVCSANNMATRTCGAGVCNGTCVANFADCDGNKQMNGCEVNLQTDPSHCGNCGTSCVANNNGHLCITGACGCSVFANDCNPAVSDNCAGTCKCGGAAACNPATQACTGGACLLIAGQPCTADGQCSGGHCLVTQTGGKVCTSIASCPVCQVMNGAGTACVNATNGTDPKSDCTTNNNGHVCESGACGCGAVGNCAATADTCTTNLCKCGAGSPCTAGTQQCQGGVCKALDGQTCNMDTDCLTGHHCLAATVGKRCSFNASCPTCTLVDTNGNCTVTALDGTDPSGSCAGNDNGLSCYSGACGCGANGDCRGEAPVCNVVQHLCKCGGGSPCIAGTQLCTGFTNLDSCAKSPGQACVGNGECASSLANACQAMTCKLMNSGQPCVGNGDCNSGTCTAGTCN